MRVEALVAEAAVERLYQRIVGRLAGSAEVERHAVLSAHRSSAFEMNSGPLSTLMVCGAPRVDAILVTASTRRGSAR
jgi:hypothetical protein